MDIGTSRRWTTMSDIGAVGIAINQWLADALPPFPALLQVIFWAILFYLISLAILAVRHSDQRFLGLGATALACSIPLFYLVCWVGYVVVKVLTGVFWLFAIIARGVAWLLGAVFTLLTELVMSFVMWMYAWLHALLGQFWWLVPAIITVGLTAALLKSRKNWLTFTKVVAQLLLTAAIVGVVAYGLRWFWSLIAPFVLAVLKFLGMILAFLAILLVRLLLGLGILLILTMIGQLLLDQIQSALSAGRRRRGVVIGALAIGASIAILLLVSNPGGINTGLPESVMTIAAAYLYQPAPMVDALIALAMVGLSIIGIWRNMPALGEEPTIDEFNKSFVYGVVGIFLAGGLAALGGGEDTTA